MIVLPQTCALGMMICTLPMLASSVKFRLIDLTVPIWSLIWTKSPSLMGRKMIIITPAATFDRVPCSARPMARPAAPMTATIEVVWMPNVLSTTTTASARIA